MLIDLGGTLEHILYSNLQCLNQYVAKKLRVAVVVVRSYADIDRCERHTGVGSGIQK